MVSWIEKHAACTSPSHWAFGTFDGPSSLSSVVLVTRSIQRGHAILDGWRLAPVCQDPQKWCTRTTSLPSDVHPSDPTRPVTRCMLVGALSQLSACQLVTV